MNFKPSDWRKSIFLNGFEGKFPEIPTRFDFLEQKAKGFLSDEAWRYISGGAGIGKTMQSNRKGFDHYQILPRMLRDVSQRSMDIELFGQKIPYPILTAPVGVLELAHHKADLNVAEACKELGMPMIFSSQSSYPMESCAKILEESPHWFQLYWSKSNELVKSFVHRAEKSGCTAIVVTLDTSVLGWRPEDLDIGHLPFMKAMGIAQYTSDPIFQELMKTVDLKSDDALMGNPFSKLLGFLQMIRNYKSSESRLTLFKSKKPIAAVKKFIEVFSNPSLTWSDLSFLRGITELPILLKGVLHPDDAKLAIEHGIDGIIVSNHGGRQVGGSISAIEALPMVVNAVDRQVPVLMDSGIRSGDDVFKAIALGANAVCIGRPYVYGMAIDGARGAASALKHIITEFDITMGLCGCEKIEDVDMSMIRKV